MESCHVVIPLQSVHSGMFVDVKVTVDEGQDVEGERHRVAHHNPPRYVAPHSHPCLRVLRQTTRKFGISGGEFTTNATSKFATSNAHQNPLHQHTIPTTHWTIITTDSQNVICKNQHTLALELAHLRNRARRGRPLVLLNGLGRRSVANGSHRPPSTGMAGAACPSRDRLQGQLVEGCTQNRRVQL
jgi:hypothetical protein